MGWTPIEEFSGVLDGNGYQIIGMNIYNGYGRIGFIRRLSGGIIRNLGLRDVTIDVEARNVGSLVGEVGRDYNYDGGDYDYGNSLIENCYCSGEIRNTSGPHTYSFYEGGLIGYMAQTTIVQNCYQKVLDQCLTDRESIDTSKYGFDIEGGTLDSGDFFVSQRLSDNSILGKLEKSLEDANSGPSSNWVAYNVVDGDMQGDDKYVIHCNEENPFPKAGVYMISYVDVGDTTEVTDGRGFTSTPPLYYMVTDTSTFEEDEEKMTEIEEKETSARDAIVMKITGEEDDDPGENSDESEVDEEQDSSTDGDYILEGSDSRYITEKEVENLSEADRRLAKNEIYARHGRRFDSADLQDYFESKSWYKGTVKPNDFDESILNKYEKANIDLISSME